MMRVDILKALAGDDELDLEYRGHTIAVRGTGETGHFVTLDKEHYFGEIGEEAYDRIAVIKHIDYLIDVLDEEAGEPDLAGFEYAGINPALSAWAIMRVNWEARTITWFNDNRGVSVIKRPNHEEISSFTYTPGDLLALLKKEA